MKKHRRPWTTQVLTQMWVPPQSNSVSYCVAPSSGDCRKKSYLHAIRHLSLANHYVGSVRTLPRCSKSSIRKCCIQMFVMDTNLKQQLY